MNWQEKQIRALLEIGTDPLDAEMAVKQAMVLAGPNDPETYIPSQAQMEALAEIGVTDLTDARSDWYASEDVPVEYRRLLDAQVTETE